jgi:hypothetical protein
MATISQNLQKVEEMKIKFRQTGGYAGLVKSIEIDSEQVSMEEAQRLQSLVDQAAFFDLPDPGQQVMPDEEQYWITIESIGRSRGISMGRSSVPTALKALINYLADQAKYEKRK